MTEPGSKPAQRDFTPASGTPSKRVNTTPLQDDRNVRTRLELENINDVSKTKSLPQVSEEEDTDGPIRNSVFPIYKLLRRQNSRLVVAEHHMNFLLKLCENKQAPKGLKIKVTTTTVELPRDLFVKWETAHVDLANRLRDLLCEYWTRLCEDLNKEIQQTIDELTSTCTQEELITINLLIEKASSKKKQELSTKRITKAKNLGRRGTAGSAGTSQ